MTATFTVARTTALADAASVAAHDDMAVLAVRREEPTPALAPARPRAED